MPASADDPGSEDRSPETDNEAVWASIVANFGDRAQLTDEDAQPEQQAVPQPTPPESTTLFNVSSVLESDAHYVPPEAPQVGLADGARGAAWLGLIGAPVLFLLSLLFGVELPQWISLLAVVAFLASMGYLFTTMRHDDDDPSDDGARV